MSSMAELAGRRPVRAPLPPVDTRGPLPPAVEADRPAPTPAPAAALPAPKPATAQLDSLLAQLVEEAPAVLPRRAAPRPVSAPATPPETTPARARLRLSWRAVGLAAASTLVLVGVAFAPRLRGLVAGRGTRPDGTLAPAPDGFEQWRAQAGDGWLI